MSIELDEFFKCIYEGRLPHAWQRVKMIHRKSMKSLIFFLDL